MSFGRWLHNIADLASIDKKAARSRQRRSPWRGVCVLNLENLEDRFAPAVQLTYGGPTTALALTERTVGATRPSLPSSLR